MTLINSSTLVDLSGKVDFVSGAARGIGEAIALRLSNAGAKVIITDINEAALARVEAQIQAAGREALAFAKALEIGPLCG